MPNIESKKGWLRSVNTDKHTLDIQLDEARIVSIVPGNPKSAPLNKPRRYNYAENIEWEDEYFYDNIGEKVRIRLEDNIVVKIEIA